MISSKTEQAVLPVTRSLWLSPENSSVFLSAETSVGAMRDTEVDFSGFHWSWGNKA